MNDVENNTECFLMLSMVEHNTLGQGAIHGYSIGTGCILKCDNLGTQDIDVFLSSRQFGTGSGFLGPRGAPVPISNVSAPPGCLPMWGGALFVKHILFV